MKHTFSFICVFFAAAVQSFGVYGETIQIGALCRSTADGTVHDVGFNTWPLFTNIVFPTLNVEGLTIGTTHFDLSPVLYGRGSPRPPIDQITTAFYAAFFDKMVGGLDMFNNTVSITFLLTNANAHLHLFLALIQTYEMPGLFADAGGIVRTEWRTENDWLYTIDFDLIVLGEGPNRVISSLGLTSMLVTKSPWSSSNTAAFIGALKIALEENIHIIGPTPQWCHNQAGTYLTCAMVSASDVCVCMGSASVLWDPPTVDKSLKLYATTHATNYELDEVYGGWRVFVMTEVKIQAVQVTLTDVREQGTDVHVHHNIQWNNWDVIYAAWLEQWVPVMHVVHRFEVVPGFAAVHTWLNGTQAMQEVHGYWSIGYGEWHSTFKFPDPLFGSSSRAVAEHIAKYDAIPTIQDGATMANGPLLKIIAEEHLPANWAEGDLGQRRALLATAIGDLNNDCMYGTVRFDRINVNNGRSAAAWQILYEDGAAEAWCVLPLLAASKQIFRPVPTWNARLGCPKGHYNGGKSCGECPAGRYSAAVTAGLLFDSPISEQCPLCESGTGTDGPGFQKCVLCSEGKSQDNTRDSGICRDCNVGYFRAASLEGTETEMAAEAASCDLCRQGFFTATPGMSECTFCPRGRYQGNQGKSECEACEPGYFVDATARSICDRCPLGTYQDEQERVTCKSCNDILPGGTTKETRAVAELDCQCPVETFNQQSYGKKEGRCVACPEGVQCPGFATVHQPPELLQSGYYSKRLLPLRLVDGVWLCMSDRACKGQQSIGDAICQDHRYGLNCGLCEDNFANAGGPGGNCHKCTGEAAILPLVLVFYFVAVGFFNFLWNERERLVEAAEPILASVTVDVALSFLQSLGIFDKMSFDWPPEFRAILNLSKLFLFDMEILKPGCLYPQTLAANYLSRLALPLVLCGGFFLWLPITRVGNIITNKRVPVFKISGMMNTVGMIVSALYISLVCSSVSVLECYKSPNGATAIRTYPYVECGQPEYLAMMPFLVLSLFIYVVGIFSIFIWLCWVAPMRLQNVFFQKATRFLVFQMQPSRWWYSVILLLRSALLALVPVFEASDGFVQILIFNFVLVVSLISHMTILPFNDQRANRLEIFDIFLLLVMLYVGSYFVFRNVDYDPPYTMTLTVILCTCVALCGAAISCFIVLGLRDTFGQKSARARDEVRIAKILSSVRAMCAIIQAAEDEQVLRMLRFASYMDRWHFDCTVNHALLELCGLQGKNMSSRRLSKNTGNITVATEEKIVANKENANKQLAKSLSSSFAAENPEVWV